MGDVASNMSQWLGVASALIAVVAAALGLPPLVRRLRQERLAGSRSVKVILPSRTRLVDRTNDVAQVLHHLDSGEYLVSIEGNIGVGKSALAMEVAHRLAERQASKRPGRSFTSLVWFDAHNGMLGLQDLARTLGLASGDATLTVTATEHKAEALRAHLAAHPTVLVIDNLRLSATDAQHLIDFLKTLPSGSLALVSANTPGRLPAPRVLLQELQYQYMQELLLREARRRGVPDIIGADDATLQRVYRVLGGNPRAIELFVLACSRDSRSLTDRLQQLEAGSTQLAEALFSAVWQDLNQAGRALLAVCAYLGGSANDEQLRVALDMSDADVEAALERLWSDGLLSSYRRQETTFYACSASLRLFVSNSFPADEVRTFAARLTDHFTRRFGRDWEDAAGASAHIDAIRLIIADLERHNRHEQCLQLFEVTLDIFFTLGLFDDRIALGWVAYDAATALRDDERRSLALSVISSTHAVRGEQDEAARTARLGLRIAREAGSTREIARQLRCVGFQLFRAGEAANALAAVTAAGEDAEAMARSCGDFNNMIDIQSLVGAAHWHLGELEQCEQTVRRFLDACEHLPWERGKAYAIRDLAEVKLMRQAFRDAELLLQQARGIAQEYRDVRQLVRVDLSAARICLFQGRLIGARKYARKATSGAQSLSLTGEEAEAEAVRRYASRAMFLPWLWLSAYHHPRIRFTGRTVGGD